MAEGTDAHIHLAGGLSMAVAPTSFSASPLPSSVRADASNNPKSGSGKQLVAQRDFNPGEVIFSVDGLLVVPRDGWGCIACSDARCMGWCDPYRYYFVDLRPVLLGVPKLAAETNTHPNILRLAIKFLALKKFGFQNQKLADLLSNTFDMVNLRDTPAQKKEDLIVSDRLFLILPDSHKTLFNKEQLANLVGIIKTNGHEVAQMQGYGLFPGANLVTHSCIPNAVYETVGTRIYFTAITQIGLGTPIAISYVDLHLPHAERKEALQANYRFDCKCKRCKDDARDYARVFYCPNCLGKGQTVDEAGTVCPSGLGNANGDWGCSKCPDPLSDNVVKEFVLLEQEVRETDVASVRVADILNLKKMHPSHYLVCRALEYRVELLARIRPTSCERFILSLLTAANDIYPVNHPKRAYYWDILGQVRKMNGDLKGCKEAFLEAVGIRDRCSPRGSPQLILAKQKSANPEKVEISLWYPTLTM